jgi:hypothetical protein
LPDDLVGVNVILRAPKSLHMKSLRTDGGHDSGG